MFAARSNCQESPRRTLEVGHTSPLLCHQSSSDAAVLRSCRRPMGFQSKCITRLENQVVLAGMGTVIPQMFPYWFAEPKCAWLKRGLLFALFVGVPSVRNEPNRGIDIGYSYTISQRLHCPRRYRYRSSTTARARKILGELWYLSAVSRRPWQATSVTRHNRGLHTRRWYP